MKLFKKTKQIIIKIDDFREEKLEVSIADQILGRLDASEKVDSLEKKAIKAGLTAANAYLATYGVPIVPEDVKEAIAESSVKALSKANKLLQKQLKKTSKAYKKRHEKDGQENV